MARLVTVMEYARAAGMSRERVVRALVSRRLRGTWNGDLHRWLVDASELDAVAAGSGDVLASPPELEIGQ